MRVGLAVCKSPTADRIGGGRDRTEAARFFVPRDDRVALTADPYPILEIEPSVPVFVGIGVILSQSRFGIELENPVARSEGAVRHVHFAVGIVDDLRVDGVDVDRTVAVLRDCRLHKHPYVFGRPVLPDLRKIGNVVQNDARLRILCARRNRRIRAFIGHSVVVHDETGIKPVAAVGSRDDIGSPPLQIAAVVRRIHPLLHFGREDVRIAVIVYRVRFAHVLPRFEIGGFAHFVARIPTRRENIIGGFAVFRHFDQRGIVRGADQLARILRSVEIGSARILVAGIGDVCGRHFDAGPDPVRFEIDRPLAHCGKYAVRIGRNFFVVDVFSHRGAGKRRISRSGVHVLNGDFGIRFGNGYSVVGQVIVTYPSRKHRVPAGSGVPVGIGRTFAAGGKDRKRHQRSERKRQDFSGILHNYPPIWIHFVLFYHKIVSFAIQKSKKR